MTNNENKTAQDILKQAFNDSDLIAPDYDNPVRDVIITAINFALQQSQSALGEKDRAYSELGNNYAHLLENYNKQKELVEEAIKDKRILIDKIEHNYKIGIDTLRREKTELKQEIEGLKMQATVQKIGVDYPAKIKLLQAEIEPLNAFKKLDFHDVRKMASETFAKKHVDMSAPHIAIAWHNWKFAFDHAWIEFTKILSPSEQIEDNNG